MKKLISEALERFTERSLENRPRLLQENRKLSLWDGGKYLIRGLSLAPGKTSGHNVCPHMGDCFASCIGFFNGFQNMDSTRAAEIARTRYAIEYPVRFRNQLDWELDKLATSAKRKGLSPLVPDQANKERKFYLFLESKLVRTETVWRRVSPLCSFENNWSVMRMGFLAWSG
jgi:hypothetical protein